MTLADYQPVEDRLRDFWTDHPQGRIITALTTDATMNGEVIIFRCDVYRETGDKVAATGYAHQRILKEPPKKKNGQPNHDAAEWTSPWEVAETSAVGRALANLGYAPRGARPSREEISKAEVSAGMPPEHFPADNAPPAPFRSGSDAGGDHGTGGTSSDGGGGDIAGEDVDPAPSSDATDDAPSLEAIQKMAGSTARAREIINEVAGTNYTPLTVIGASPFERKLAAAWIAENP